MVVGTLSFMQKVKPEDAVDAVCSGIVVYGGGDIVSLMQKGQTSGYSVQWTQCNSDICKDLKGILTFVH